MGTDGKDLQAVAAERKDAQCPGGIGWSLRAGRWSGSRVKAVGRLAVPCTVESGIVAGSEVRSTWTAGKRAKGSSCSLRCWLWLPGEEGTGECWALKPRHQLLKWLSLKSALCGVIYVVSKPSYASEPLEKLNTHTHTHTYYILYMCVYIYILLAPP